MIKRILFLFAISHCFYFSVQAQITNCGSVNPHPAILQEYDTDPSRSFNATYIIPVVFHIYYDTTIYNQPTVSMAEIDTVLAQANRIINLYTNDAAFVIPYFQPIIGNLSVELRRSTLDTNGNCYSGVVYHNLVSGLGSASMLYPNYAYDPNRYLNIHINQAITGFAPGAFAYFPEPYTIPAPQYDGIVFRLSDLFYDKILVHEAGHYLGLLHTFGLTNSVGGGCGNDFVSDTPPTNGSPGNCDTSMDVCTPGVVENVQNHMDYSDDACRIMFTDGQASRVDAILNDTTLSRRYIWKPANLNATGVDIAQTCNIFEGQIIYQPAATQSCSAPNIFGFVLWTKYDNADSVLWTTSEGIISDPESEEIEILFSSNGPKTITLTCYYNGTSYVYVKSIVVNMQAANGLDVATVYPYQQNFENGFALPNGNLKVQNNAGNPWQLHTGNGYNSDSCLFIPIETGVGIDTNTIVLGTFNMLNLDHPQLSFKISTAKGSNVIDRKLIVRARSLCSGDVFLYKFDYDSLFALNNTASNFFPTSTSQWKTINILLDGYFYQNYARRDMEFSIQLIKYFEPGMVDENIFIDNINLADTVASIPPVAGLTVSNYNICGSAPTLEFSEQCTNVPDSVKWFFNGFPLFGNPPAFYNILPPLPDTSVVTLIAYNSFGTDTITKLVIHRQIYAYSISANPNPICQGDSTTLQATLSNSDNYVWENISSGNPNLYILTNNDSVILVNPNTTQTFKVTATNIYGCSASTTVQVNVTPLPYVSITAPVCVYEGSTIQLSTPPGPGYLYNWSPAVGLNETDTNIVHALIDSTITYQVTVTNNGCSFSQTATVHA